jgi:2-isopropylmalate synthase
MFWKEYIDRSVPYKLEHFHADGSAGIFRCRASLTKEGQPVEITGEGNGPVAAFVSAILKEAGAPKFEIANYKEHALGSGAHAHAIAYMQIKLADGSTVWGAGVDSNIELASIKAVFSAVNRASVK